MKIPKINNPKLAKQVFTHRSYLNETNDNQMSNERLEFLGDAILAYIVSSFLFKKHPNAPEGDLTNLRSILTNTQTLYLVAKQLDLGKKLLLSKGEEANNGRHNRSILANTYEAVVGGLYLDQGMEATRQFIIDTILDQRETLIKEQGLKDPKSALQERLQETYASPPTYKVVAEKGPDHDKRYTVQVEIEGKKLATGEGTSKQTAEKRAARKAFQTLSAVKK